MVSASERLVQIGFAVLEARRTVSHSNRKVNDNCQFLYKKEGKTRHDILVYRMRLDVELLTHGKNGGASRLRLAHENK